MGSEQLHALRSSYRVLVVHLLTWQFQPQRRSRSWTMTIDRERDDTEDREETNRALRKRASQIVEYVYPKAVRRAARETGLARDAFPAECPYTIEQLRDPDWMPS